MLIPLYQYSGCRSCGECDCTNRRTDTGQTAAYSDASVCGRISLYCSFNIF